MFYASRRARAQRIDSLDERGGNALSPLPFDRNLITDFFPLIKRFEFQITRDGSPRQLASASTLFALALHEV
jgi:hypothetical protein